MKIEEYLIKKGFEYEFKNRPSGDNFILVCPFCNGGESNEKSFAINAETGLWNCKRENNCGKSGTFFQLQKLLGDNPQQLEKQKTNLVNNKKKNYCLKKVIQIPLSNNSIKYLTEERKFTSEIINKFKLFDGIKNDICLPYYKNNIIVNVKSRLKHIKKFFQWENPEPTLYNIDNVVGNDILIITEGECLPGNTQLLTENGWKNISEYNGEKILQYNNDNSGSFIKPNAYIKKKYIGNLIKNSSKGYVSITTPKHNMIAINHKGELRKHHADNNISSIDKIPRVTYVNENGINLNNYQIALCLAISADFTIDYRKCNNYKNFKPKEKRYARGLFKKERKIIRINNILNNTGIKFSCNKINNNYTSICFSMPDWITEKKLPIDWIYKASLKQRKFIIEEMVHWNGNNVPNRNQYEYATKYYDNAIWMQTIAHTCGYVSTIMKRKNKIGEWYKVSILKSKKYTSWQCIKREKIHYNDFVYCVSVPSGMIIIKQEDKISITGNCDCIALTQYGLQNVVSPPCGANGLSWIEHEWEFLEKFKEIIVAFDSDIAGQKDIDKIVSRLGIWRCKSVTFPYKDANECLKNNVSKEEIFNCFQNAKNFTPIEIKSAGSYCDEVLDIYRNPERYIGDDTGFLELDEVLRGFRQGEVTLWTGQNNSGKSTILNQICLYQASKEKKCCIASLEMKPSRYLKWAVEQALGKDNPTEEEIIKTFEWIDEYIYVLDIQDNILDTKILELFEFTSRKYGINHFVIDSLMKVRFNEEGDDMILQVKFLNNYIDFCKKMSAHGHIVAHPRKQDSDKDKPDKTDVKGRGELTDLVDNVIIVWRNIDNKDDIEEEFKIDGLLIVRKNREFGDLANIPIKFDPTSRRFMCKSQLSFF